MNLTQINQMSASESFQFFQTCCASKKWCEQMVNARPFSTQEQLKNYASHVWSILESVDYLQAFEAHPMIGDISSLKEKFSNTAKDASMEQAGAASASEDVLIKLSELNHQYFARHGFIFIICATGQSAQAMLDALINRIDNSTDDEISNAAEQQIKITRLRLDKFINQEVIEHN